jgi:hypothetical protein
LNDVAARLTAVEKELANLRKAVSEEAAERKRVDDEIKKLVQDLALIDADNNKATGLLISYLTRTTYNYWAMGTTFQGAINDFNLFLGLPEDSTDNTIIWDIAWAVLAIAMPALRLSKVFSAIEKKSDDVLAAARAANQSPALKQKIMEAAQKGSNIASVVAGGNDIRSKVQSAVQSTGSPPVFDTSKAPVKLLLAQAAEAAKALDKLVAALSEQYSAYVNLLIYGVPFTKAPNALEQQAKTLLDTITFLEGVDLERAANRFLWNIMSSWTLTNVTIVYKKVDGQPAGIEYEGLNASQQTKILEWFGHKNAMLGEGVPAALNIEQAMIYLGAKSREQANAIANMPIRPAY